MYRQTDKLLRDLTKAINGEYSAVQCYQKIANMAPSEKERKQILEIREDEIKHLQTFTQIYVNLTGRQPQPQIIEECPNTYKAGIDFAFIDEQETVDFYLGVSDEITDVNIKNAFKRAASDEQNHAVWFLYFINKRK
ncbi:ferritin-like domain-containing protein [Bacillus sp. FJAT-29937]|uniref:ferritin-like domain-containing protein n=1 Tax=Bacillus sp. FJAT-29937 TaxID=1720553 RepID=UPI0012E340CA|nr:ferritin-like domain-containing protein [Bacillus sp. FJAT-29937]